MAEYIEREAAIRAVCEVAQSPLIQMGLLSWAGVVQKECREKIEAIPAVDVAPVRHGRWLPYSTKLCLYRCSECNSLPRDRTPYCPLCGAKMEKEANNEN